MPNIFSSSLDCPTWSFATYIANYLGLGGSAADIVLVDGLVGGSGGMVHAGDTALHPSITGISVANPTVITTAEPHGFETGDTTVLGGPYTYGGGPKGTTTNSTPSVNGYHVVTVLSPTTFTVPVNVTGAGNAGTYMVGCQVKTSASRTALGKGVRHWRNDGPNANDGGVQVGTILTGDPEYWARFYMRYQNGFQWAGLNYTKDVYLNVSSGSPVATLGFHSTDKFGITPVNPGGTLISTAGWNNVYPGGIADGSWHCYEYHVKMDTNGSNGVAETWIDSTRVQNQTNLNWGTTGGWYSLLFGSNQLDPGNSQHMYTDYDDMAISLTGQIGPVGGTPPVAGAVRRRGASAVIL